MKHEWRKEEKALYLPPAEPTRVQVPAMRYFTIEGRGDPNGEAFSECVSALYAMAYTLLMLPRKHPAPPGWEPYALYPLEGMWTMASPWRPGQPLDKALLVYTAMIRQPDFVDEALFAQVRDIAAQKKAPPRLLDAVALSEITDGDCVQMMHRGPFDLEAESFARMDAYAEANHLRRTWQAHREIYLSDPRRAKPETMKTVLRYGVAPM